MNPWIVTFGGTLLGAFLGFTLAMRNEKKKRERTYDVLIHSLAFEWQFNGAIIEETLDILKSANMSFRRLREEASSEILRSPLLYEFVPSLEFINKLRVYNEAVRLGNRALKYCFEEWKSGAWRDQNLYNKDFTMISNQFDKILELSKEVGILPVK